MELALRDMGLDPSMMAAIHEMLEFTDDSLPDRPHPPSRAFVRDNKAVRNTAADFLEYPNSYVFIVDMPGVKPDQIKVEVEDGNVLVVSGERRREKDKEHKEGVKYIRMERRQGKYLKKFELPEDANLDSIEANYQDGVLTVTVAKRPPPEQKKPRRIEVKAGSGQSQIGGRDFGDVKVDPPEQQLQGAGTDASQSH